jgi:hypothetical protein
MTQSKSASQQKDARYMVPCRQMFPQMPRNCTAVSTDQDISVLFNPLQNHRIRRTKNRRLLIANDQNLHLWFTKEQLIPHGMGRIFIQQIADIGQRVTPCSPPVFL